MLVIPVHRAVAAIADCCPVVLDDRQYERAIKLGLAGRMGRVEFEGAIFDGQRWKLAMHCEDQRESQTAFMLPALGADREIYDVIAWIPETGKVASLLGEVGVLGLWTLADPHGDPPMVHDSLLDWFLADAPGLFILDPRIAAGEIDGLTIAAPDRAAALRLHSRLAPFCSRPPQIVVPKVRKAA